MAWRRHLVQEMEDNRLLIYHYLKDNLTRGAYLETIVAYYVGYFIICSAFSH